eukprot:TRINITY_DN2568_c0_g1_i1.p1 TRINITY_DN2568_c0_g1~~TRINITY_DN2568_c0_g1_i1.p1  ORF type:complete len:219 (+),score=42.95 TRINITY_DN2568_c0_g1_i1:155-811(+)
MMVRVLVLVLLLALSSAVVGHDHHEFVVNSEEHQYVTCGSVIKLAHFRHNVRLHSHEVAYGSGSRQQSVTGQNNKDDDGSYWVVQGPLGQPPCKQGDAFTNKGAVRLLHVNTQKYLHSHGHQSPLSQQQEVSAFGNGRGDMGDNWVLHLMQGEKEWKRNAKVRLQHQSSHRYLEATDFTYRQPIHGQREIVCLLNPPSQSSTQAIWTASEGVFFAKNE